MKKTIAILLTVMILLPMFSVFVLAVPAEASGDMSTGLTFTANSDSSPTEEYYSAKKFEEIPHTYSAWVYLPNNTTRHGIILGSNHNLVRNDLGYYDARMFFEIASGNKPRLFTTDQAGSSLGDHKFTTVLPTAEWVYVTVVVDDEAQAVRLYVNGEHAETLTESYAPIDPTTFDYIAMLGGDHRVESNIVNEHYFKGGLKDVHLYTDVRTEAEIAADYQNGPDLTDKNLFCAYDIDASDAGKDIVDLSGNGYDMLSSTMWLTEDEMAEIREAYADYEYSFVAVPDTQYTTEFYPENLAPIYDWIVANKDEKKIEYVFGLGDITNTDTDAAKTADNGEYEWRTAYEQISKLNGVVDYSIIRGNHDVYNGGTGLDTYFGGDDFYAQQFTGTTGGVYNMAYDNYDDGTTPAYSVANTWRTFEAGGDNWLVISLDYAPKNELLEWAGEIADAHPDHRTIIVTHGYLNLNGRPTDRVHLGGIGAYSWLEQGYNNGDGTWDKLVSRHANIELVLCGHVDYPDIVVAQNKNAFGNTVTQMLIDGQAQDKALGGLGLVAILYLSDEGQTMNVEYYSTVRQRYFRSINQFELDLNAEGTEFDEGWDGMSASAPLGSGTAEDPYLIGTPGNLYWMSRTIGTTIASSTTQNPFSGVYFEQIRDIDLNGYTMTPIGYFDNGTSIYVFGGIYDGKGFKISNGSFALPSSIGVSQNFNPGVGIFGVAKGAEIRNVVADNITVSGITNVGVIVGRSYDSWIDNCVVTDTCKVIGTGSKLGVATTSSTVTGASQYNHFTQNRLGGIAGHSDAGRIHYCVSNATVYSNGNNALAGGIVGSVSGGNNVQYNSFGGAIINDFTDTAYNREIIGENVNGGIIGYMGSGYKNVSGGSRNFTRNINSGSFKIIGTATTDVVYGGIIGVAKDLGATTAINLKGGYNLSNDITLGEQTVAVYVAGLVGRVERTDTSKKPLTISQAAYTVSMAPITNGGLNVPTVYTTSDICNYTGDGAIDKLSNGYVKTVDEITALNNLVSDEATYAATREAGRRIDDVLNTVGYQVATAEGDHRVRLVFGLNTLELNNYGYELTLTYTENGETVTKKAALTGTIVYTDIKGGAKDYNATKDYGYAYFATLVIDPTIAGEVIAGEAVCTVSAYTVTTDGYKLCYGTDLITLVFHDGVLTEPEANLD